MKHNESHDNAKSDGLQLMPVRFEFAHPTARTVGVAGTFNDWRSKTKSMIPLGNGRWLKEMVLPAGTYEYCLVVDGECMPDPLSKDYVPNPFGGRNSILKVASWPEAARLHGAPTETALPPRMVSERQGGQKSRNPPPQAATKSPNKLQL